VPISRDIKEFGVATVRISDPPVDDSPTTWSLYAGGLDPAPFVATNGDKAIMVARVRPEGPGVDARRRLEIGSVDARGDFNVRGTIDTSGRPKDLAIVRDAFGAHWIHFTDVRGSFLERRLCP
jgi:hypothetical protein